MDYTKRSRSRSTPKTKKKIKSPRSPRTSRRSPKIMKSSRTSRISPHMYERFLIKNDLSVRLFFNEEYENEDPVFDIELMKILLSNIPTLKIYPNDDVDRGQTYKNVSQRVFQIVNKSKFLCTGLNDEYIKSSMSTSEAIVVLGSEYMNIYPNGNVFGFALLEIDHASNQLYVDILCSHKGIKGAGDVLIKSIETIAKELHLREIKLNSVKSAVSFYEKYGFRKIQMNGDLTEMIKRV